MRKIKSRELRDKLAATLSAVENGASIVIEQYNRPVARLIPYKETVIYTVEIQATDNGTDWQTMNPTPETITDLDAADMGYTDAADVARDIAGHQNIAEGEDWRVRVWEGENPDLGTEPDGECYWHEITK